MHSVDGEGKGDSDSEWETLWNNNNKNNDNNVDSQWELACKDFKPLFRLCSADDKHDYDGYRENNGCIKGEQGQSISQMSELGLNWSIFTDIHLRLFDSSR